MDHRRLHDPVANRRNPQRTLFVRPRFGDPHPPDRLRTEESQPQFLRELPQVVVQISTEFLRRDVIHARSAIVACDLFKGRPQVALRVHLVDQSKPNDLLRTLTLTVARAFNIRSVQTVRSPQPQRNRGSPTC